MKTIDEAGWAEIWDGDLTRYDSAKVQTVLDHEVVGVRFDKIISYLRDHQSPGWVGYLKCDCPRAGLRHRGHEND